MRIPAKAATKSGESCWLTEHNDAGNFMITQVPTLGQRLRSVRTRLFCFHLMIHHHQTLIPSDPMGVGR